MARKRKITTKQCAMTGMNFPVTEFYKNNTTADGLHPYAKKADNFRFVDFDDVSLFLQCL